MFATLNCRALGLTLGVMPTLRLAASAGFEGVDLMVRDLVDEGLDPYQVRLWLEDLNLLPGAWPLPVHWRGRRDQFQADLKALPRYARAAATIGLERTATWVMPRIPGASDETSDAPRDHSALVDWHVERLSAVARVLGDHGIRLGLEAIGVALVGGGTEFLTRLSALGPILEPLRALEPGTGLLVDSFHLRAAGEGIVEALSLGAPGIVAVHVADLAGGAPEEPGEARDDERDLPGTRGLIDVRGLLEALDRAGYDGPVTVETFKIPVAQGKGPTVEAAVGRVAAALRHCWPRGQP